MELKNEFNCGTVVTNAFIDSLLVMNLDIKPVKYKWIQLILPVVITPVCHNLDPNQSLQ